jgi:hypothetical protein
MSASTDPHLSAFHAKLQVLLAIFLLTPATIQDMKFYKRSFEGYSLASKTGKTI